MIKNIFKGLGHIALAVIAAQAVRQHEPKTDSERISELLRFNNEFEERARRAEWKLKNVKFVAMANREEHIKHLARLDHRHSLGPSAGINSLTPSEVACRNLIQQLEKVRAELNHG